MEIFAKIVGVICIVVVIIAVAAVITAFPVMWLWNWLMPSIFGLCKITFWQALGLSLLSGLLIKSHQTTSKQGRLSNDTVRSCI